MAGEALSPGNGGESGVRHLPTPPYPRSWVAPPPAPPQIGRMVSSKRSRVGKPYRRADVSEPDEYKYVWVDPTASQWPNVKGDPPGPRTLRAGYSLEEKRLQIVFRPDKYGHSAVYDYQDVTPQEWERLRRIASTGKLINRLFNGKPYHRIR